MKAEYEGSRIQTFICKFKDRQLKQLNKKLKELGDKIKKTDRSNHSNRLPSYTQLRTKTTQDIKITLILKSIKTNYKTWTFIVKTAKNIPNVQSKKKKVLISDKKSKNKIKMC